MKWRQPADRHVVEAVLAPFRFTATAARTVLSQLTEEQWERSYYWLDANGMALYLLTRLEEYGITDALPLTVLTRLQRNLADNRNRVEFLLKEFTALNTLFTQAGISYCNLKGFTLVPDSCARYELRNQLDFDFLIDGKDIPTCRLLLEQRGYVVRGETLKVLEFKTDCSTLPTIADLYRPRTQQCVELHFTCDSEGNPSRDVRLDRVRVLNMQGLDIPALCSVDQFIGQATHLFGHLCGANTRLAWVLEFIRNMQTHQHDEAFWCDVRAAAHADSKDAIALGVATTLAAILFSPLELPETSEWMLNLAPTGVRDWVLRYGRRALLADTPGTKLGLLLKDELNRSDPKWSDARHTALVPAHRAPRIIPHQQSDGWRKRLRNEVVQLRYDLFRFRFHLVEGTRYVLESHKWRRARVRQASSPKLSSAPPVLTKSRPEC